jgi:hypothetical protein
VKCSALTFRPALPRPEGADLQAPTQSGRIPRTAVLAECWVGACNDYGELGALPYHLGNAGTEAVLQLLMETDVEGLIGAGRYERSGERTTWRNGYVPGATTCLDDGVAPQLWQSLLVVEGEFG